MAITKAKPTLKTGRLSKKAITSVQSSGEDMVRMNVNISKVFHKKLKQRALDEEITLTELVIQSLERHIKGK